MLGEELFRQYKRWTQSLRLTDLLDFLNSIQDSKESIGAPQFFGKFRATSLEEFVYRLLKTKLTLPKRLQVFWSEKCLIWKGNSQRYGVETDVSIGRKIDGFVKPLVAIDAKVELDASRLKTALASMLLIKRLNRKARCFIVYIRREISHSLLDAVDFWIDGIFHFSLRRNQTTDFLRIVQNAIIGVQT
jgi:hypothetical protein